MLYIFVSSNKNNMNNYKLISTEENFKENLAETLSYCILTNQCLMIHKNNHGFALVSPDKVSARMYQGFVECVSNETLCSLLGTCIELSPDGEKEFEIVNNWMAQQA